MVLVYGVSSEKISTIDSSVIRLANLLPLPLLFFFLDQAVLAVDPGWKKSNFGELEKYILDNLDGGQRAKLKMTNPLGVADHVVTQYVTNIDSQMGIIRAGIKTKSGEKVEEGG